MSLEEAMRENTQALTRLADLIERKAEFLQHMQEPYLTHIGGTEGRFPATIEGGAVVDSMPPVCRQGERRKDAVTPAKLEEAVEKAVEKAIEEHAPALAEAIAEAVEHKEEQAPKIMMAADMVFQPGEEIPEFTWEGVAKQFRKYAQKHGRDEAVKLAKEFGLNVPLNKDDLKADKYEEFYYACSN